MCEATSSTNRQHKDRLFKKVFGTKEDLLSLYNAINNTDYSDPNDVEINTVEDFIYMSMKNDVSFLIYDVLNLYEHQSSQNPNMAFRGFLYLAELYKGMFSGRQDLYSSVRLALPTPQFIVFYNGTADEPDESFIKMSDAYVGNISGEPSLECTARLLNINYGHNKELMDKCKRLHDYSALIKKIRDNQKAGMNNVEAIDKAVDDCIKENLLADILSKHRLEVTQVLLTEYDEELHINNEKDISYNKGLEQGLEQGIERGIEQGRNEQLLESIKNLMTNLGLSAEEAMKSLGIEQANFDKYLKMM
ncbi:hypothetical protein [Pseudobutyrivibrio sp.]|uniref:hypothetical protein n=1 Tax=Pseudobutyrivibrio sp. TaxID=2014367 RepID=UPI001DDB654C|nr:hypothetical protein [Pseudobutyrivibrio sp.]MBE5912201.1 hypothetical protein [Pseudobutyrivibrio sp.]